MVSKLIVHSIKTDNANLSAKIKLRRLGTSKLPYISVLDCFAGENHIWKSGDFILKRYYGIEKEKNKGQNLTADNLRVISSLDLSSFNVIDLDSYGIPFNQLDKLFKNGTLRRGTIIFFTAISNKLSGLNKSCLQEFNLTKMYSKAPTLFNSIALDLFFAYLYSHGIREITKFNIHSPNFIKIYGFFVW